MDTHKESVLIISPFFSPNTGGVETHLTDLCEYMRKHDHKVIVSTYQPITTKDSGKSIEIKKNLRISRMKWFGHNMFPKLEPYPVLEIIYLFPGLFFQSFFLLLNHRKEIDTIHAHGLVASLIAKFLAIIYKKRLVMSMHAIYYLDERPFFSKAVRWLLSSFDVVLALAERSRKDLISAGIPKRKIKIYTQWVDQSVFKPLNRERCKKELNLNYDFIVLFIGRFIEKKGVKVIIEAASMVKSNIKFVMVGDGPLSENIKRVSLKQENIIFRGRVPLMHMPKYYNAADVFIIPSQYEEGFARVTLEALSSGTPVIAANKGCLPEMVTPSVGMLIEPSAEIIAEKLDYMSRNPHILRGIRKNCRPYAEKCFSENNTKLIEDSYRVV